jgi:micrococcal nuclease
MRTALAILLLAVATAAQTAQVKYISDGDSFILESGERVRMIGINAPELGDKFGPESKEHLARLIRGKTVVLGSDPQNDDRDVHGRLLRYVSVNGTDINRQMIAEGWAYAFLRYRFARSRRDAYRDAETSAKASGVGLWAAEPNGASQSIPKSAERPTLTPFPSTDNEPAKSLQNSNFLLLVVCGSVLILILLIAVRLFRRARA